MKLFSTLGRLQLVVLLCAALVGVATVNADTLTVTTTADAGAGSLRAAIAAASNGDTIQFDATLNGHSIMLTSAELAIDKNITIDGPGADQLAVKKSSGSPDFRIFHILLGHTVIIEGLTIDGNGTLGAGVWNDRATLTIDGCVVQGCHGYGGVLCNASFGDDSYLVVVTSIIRNNQADVAGGGIHNEVSSNPVPSHAILSIRNSVVGSNTVGSSDTASGGGIWNNGEMDITNSTVSSNVSGGNGSLVPFGNGGGISSQEGSVLFITNCTISGNSAGLNGGGVYNAGGLATIGSSTVSGNSAFGINDLEGWGDGGGICNSSSITITNSTVSNNSSSRSGGGVSNHASMTIGHSTFSGNTAFEGGTIANYNGGTQIGNTALKVSTSSPSISNISGTITSNGYNLINDNGSGFLTGPGDQINTEPMLGPLQDNGGPTFTHELLTGSPAIDTGDPNFTPPPANDQRGPLYQRVFNGRIDIGSLEVQPAPPTPTPTVTPVPVGADLALTESDSPDPVQVGGNLTYIITVFNLAPNTATAASVVDTLPAGVNFVSATPSQGSCTGTSTVVCEMGSLQGGANVTISLVVTPTAAGTLSNTATVSGFEDPNPSNNSDTELTTVTSVPTPTPTPTTTPPATPTPTPTPPTATPTPTPTATPSPSPARALNMSTRMLVETGDRVGIGGFIIAGSVPKHVLLRAVGPSLAQFGIPNPLPDPVMELHGPPGFVTIINDNCDPGDFGSPFCEPGSLDAMIEATLDPGAYTAIVKGKNDTTGVGLVEIYDLDQAATSRLANLSTRAFVGTGANIVIAGVLLGGSNGDDKVIIRGIGPSLTGNGVPDALADPTLELRDENGALLVANDNWQDNPDQATEITAAGLAPEHSFESGIAATLPPGPYTALLAGSNNGTGIGVVEVYDLGGPP